MNTLGKIAVLTTALLGSVIFYNQSSTQAAVDSDVSIQINDELLEFSDAKPFIDGNNKVQLPVRSFVEKIGFAVNWANEEGQSKIVLTKGNTQIEMAEGSDTALVNGQTVPMGTKMAVVNERVYVPFRFAGDVLGFDTYWETKARLAMVSTDGTRHKPKVNEVSVLSAERTISDDIVKFAQSFHGIRYVWGGNTPSGFDCSGFVNYVFEKYGIQLPRISRDIHKVGTPVAKSELEPGDLVFFAEDHNNISHVGIYVGNNQFVSATSSRGVHTTSLSVTYWASTYTGAKRIIK